MNKQKLSISTTPSLLGVDPYFIERDSEDGIETIEIGRREFTKIDHPFKLKPYVDGDGNLVCQVLFGAINNKIPTNMWSVVNEGLPVSQNGTSFITLTMSSTGHVVTSAVLSSESSPPQPLQVTKDSPPSSFAILIGVVVEGKPFQNVNSPLFAYPKEVITERVVNASVGQYPTVGYYQWTVGTSDD